LSAVDVEASAVLLAGATADRDVILERLDRAEKITWRRARPFPVREILDAERIAS
jgi:hypothetical protein